MEQKKEPPIGIMPEWLWKENRMEELKETIERYEKSDFQPQKAWFREVEKLKHEIIKSKFAFQRGMQEEKKMDNVGAIGGTPANIEAIKKKLEKGEKFTPDDIAAITNTNGCDQWGNIWMLLAILIAFSSLGGNSSADYWRGKYDAYKELHENKNKGEPNG